ncbi:transposase, partial [Porphyromonas cangingivalis]
QSLFDQLFVDDIHMITRIKKNMKNSLMHLYDKVLLRKRALIETVNDMLKNVCQIEHTRHRSVNNFLANLISGLIAYNLLPKKPELNIEIVRNPQLPTCA